MVAVAEDNKRNSPNLMEPGEAITNIIGRPGLTM